MDVRKLREEQKTKVALNTMQEHTAKQLQDMQVKKTFAIPGSEFQVIMSNM